MPAENPGRGKFAKLMTHHVFCNVYRNKLVAGMNSNRMADKLRRYVIPARLGLHNLFVAAFVHLFDLHH
jgi:hypothetical protein